MRYAKYDNGRLISLGEGPALPGEMLELSNEDYEALISQYNRAIEPDPVAAAKRRINDEYQGYVDSLTAPYPAAEVASWVKQEDEARSIIGSTPWIDAAAVARGITSNQLATLIKAKADAFTLLHAAATGKRQRLQDEIDALVNPTQDQLNAIQW